LRRGNEGRVFRRLGAHDIRLVSTEEEQLIADDRSTQNTTELIALQWIAHRSKCIAGIEHPVAYELEKVSVKFVCAGLGDHIDGATRVLPGSTSAPSACTSTFSDTCPTSSATLITGLLPTCNRIPVCTNVRKPASAASSL